MPYKDHARGVKQKRKWNRLNKERLNATESKRRAGNPRAFKNSALKYRYGITHDQFDQLLEAQGGLCALCKSRHAAHVDHCHRTMRVRGILCAGCNVGLGIFGDSVDRLLEAIAYLKEPGSKSDGG